MVEKSAGSSDQLFRQDSTLFLEAALAAYNGVSSRSFNFPDRFLRHRNFQLFLDPRDSPNLAADATFFRVQLIDHGPDLNPVDD